MRIGFDVSQTGKTKAGCGYFADGMIRQLAAADRDNEYVLFPAIGDFFWDPHGESTTFTCDLPNFRRMLSPPDLESAQRFWRHPKDDFEVRIGDLDILHTNNFFCPRGLSKTRLVYTLYDLSFIEEPAWTTESNRAGCFKGVFEASLRADFIVSISDYTRSHFLKTFPDFPEDRISVIHPASRFKMGSESVRTRQLLKLQSEQFWLAVGTIEPRKNYDRLLQAYRLHMDKAGSAMPLVIAGGPGWLMERFDPRRYGLKPGRDIFLPGYLSDSELAWLFRNCFAFVYPSLFEGFGMPVLEAISLGAPVLCSNTSSLPEAGGKAAAYFDPADVHSIAAAMSQLTRSEAARAALKSATAQQAERFSWARSASRLTQLYDQVMNMPRRPRRP